MTFFEFFDLPANFIIDEKLLKQRFLQKSKQYHPDFYTLSDTAEQERILQLSTLNNHAYQTLSDANSRIKYVLELNGLLEDGERYALPPDFLMEMMDINENLMTLNANFDAQRHQQIEQQINTLEQQLQKQITQLTQAYDNHPKEPKKTENILEIKKCYYKMRYLLRTKKTCRTFATL